MDTERRAMILLRLIVEAFLEGGGGEEWQFCLAISLLLVEIAKNNITKGDTVKIALPSIDIQKYEYLDFLRMAKQCSNGGLISKLQRKCVMFQIDYNMRVPYRVLQSRHRDQNFPFIPKSRTFLSANPDPGMTSQYDVQTSTFDISIVTHGYEALRLNYLNIVSFRNLL